MPLNACGLLDIYYAFVVFIILELDLGVLQLSFIGLSAFHSAKSPYGSPWCSSSDPSGEPVVFGMLLRHSRRCYW